MKKTNQKGFMLTETLIVSIFVLTVMVSLYTQFRSMNTSYGNAFRYNTPNALYAAENIRTFLLNDNIIAFERTFLDKSTSYIDLTSCSLEYNISNNNQYCKKLYEILEVKTVIFTYVDLKLIRDDIEDNSSISINSNVKKFIKTIDTSSVDLKISYDNLQDGISEYRNKYKELINNNENLAGKFCLIVELQDGTLATIKV